MIYLDAGDKQLYNNFSSMTIEEILAAHPHLTRGDIYAAPAFAADYLADEQIAFG